VECVAYPQREPLDHRTSYPDTQLIAKKKTVIASERDPWARAHFAVIQENLDPAQIVVVDEFGSNLDLTRRYARAPEGERAIAAIPRNTPINTTTISSMTTTGMGPAMMIAGGVTQSIFETYLAEVLGPTLHPGQIVVIDNLSAHKSRRSQEIVAAKQCLLLFLPTYSPDYAPIELAFAKIKEYLRSVGARTREALETAIAEALTRITAADAQAFFRHCGYRVIADLAQWFCSPL
jgi:transposase